MSDWFAVWAKRHCAVFGLGTSEAEVLTVAAWKAVFDAADYAAAELAEATDFLAQNPQALAASEVRYLGKLAAHLAAIQARIRDRRAVEYRRETERPDRGTCSHCGGSGFVTVPHLAGVRGGAWKPIKTTRSGANYYTMAVLCHCPLGRWAGEHQSKHRSLTLEEYSGVNAAWPAQLAQREEHQRAAAKLGPGNPAFDEVLKRLKELAASADN